VRAIRAGFGRLALGQAAVQIEHRAARVVTVHQMHAVALNFRIGCRLRGGRSIGAPQRLQEKRRQENQGGAWWIYIANG
jgi:hypothetical protein